jgi:hypothetical protein
MYLSVLLEDPEAYVEHEEHHAPHETDTCHQIRSRPVVNPLVYGAADNRSEDLTGREKGAVETRPIVRDKLVQGLILTLDDVLFDEDSFEGVWEQRDEDETLGDTVQGETDKHQVNFVWEVKGQGGALENHGDS